MLERKRGVRRFPWIGLLPLLALALYALPDRWHREWRLALAGTWRQAGAGDSPEPAEPADDAAERAAALLAERARLLDELSEIRAFLEQYEIVRRGYPRFRLVAARLEPAEYADPGLALMNRGELDGLSPGDAVLLGDALLGVVTRVGPRTSWMRYISAADARLRVRAVPPAGEAAAVSATAAPPRELGMLFGAGRHQALATFYTFDTPVDRGWLLLTHGGRESTGLPDGIFVGTIDGKPRETGQTGVRTAPVRLAAEALRGLQVMVVREVEPAPESAAPRVYPELLDEAPPLG